MNQPLFALIDCNNFFVSCERLFRPDLEGKPVVVLSSNDGCVVARSNEAKALGIPMAAPAFKHRQTFQNNQVVQFSANFELYGDISRRITSLLTTITPRIEIYSVDESFLDISRLPVTDYLAWGKAVRASISRHIGVPVSIGIAPSKTLAKLASEVAKQHDEHGGVFSFAELDPATQQRTLSAMPIHKVWGVGWRLAPRIRAEGISHVAALANLRPGRAQQLMGIRGRQLVAELNGVSCFGLEKEQKIAKSIMRGRTFGEDTNQAHVLEAAIATLATQAAFQLRTQGLLTRRVGFFTDTNRHKPGYQRWAREIRLDTPTNDSGQIISLLCAQLKTFFSDKQRYHQLGVFMHDFTADNALQTDLLGITDTARHDRSKARMEALDTVNNKWGRGKLYYAAEGLSDAWQPRKQIRSPRYLTQWDELPEARIYTVQ